VYLSCTANEIIIISKVENKLSTTCSDGVAFKQLAYADCLAFDDTRVKEDCECLSFYDEDVTRSCNGQQSCLIQLWMHQNYLVFYGGTCRYQPNQVLIEYICLPSKFLIKHKFIRKSAIIFIFKDFDLSRFKKSKQIQVFKKYF